MRVKLFYRQIAGSSVTGTWLKLKELKVKELLRWALGTTQWWVSSSRVIKYCFVDWHVCIGGQHFCFCAYLVLMCGSERAAGSTLLHSHCIAEDKTIYCYSGTCSGAATGKLLALLHKHSRQGGSTEQEIQAFAVLALKKGTPGLPRCIPCNL